MNIGIVGAGIAGRLCAWTLSRAGHRVTIFEKSARHSQSGCSFVAAGLLTPMAEAANGDPALAELGKSGLSFWKTIAASAGALSELVSLKGSISLTFKSDEVEFLDFEKKLAAKGISFRQTPGGAPGEPDLDQDNLRYHIIEGEGAVDTNAFMRRLLFELGEFGVSLQFSSEILKVSGGNIATAQKSIAFDHVVDCRGFAAGTDLPNLRGVRGEVIHLRAPEVNITRPVRVLHRRSPVYIVPRSNHEYVIGATSIESNDAGPITVKSTLDLLNAIYNIHHGFRYASIIKTAAGCRPAFPDNLPRVDFSSGITRVNGLFRHGFLLGPLVADTVGNLLAGSKVHPSMTGYVQAAV